MGRAPKPTRLKVLEGTFRKDKAPKNEPSPRPVAPKKPSWLTGAGGRLWKKLAPKLLELGLLTEIDGEALAALCLHYHLMTEAAKSIKKEGITTIDERGLPRKHPLLQVLRDNSTAMKGYLLQFGLTPSARSKIDLPELDEMDENEYLFD